MINHTNFSYCRVSYINGEEFAGAEFYIPQEYEPAIFYATLSCYYWVESCNSKCVVDSDVSAVTASTMPATLPYAEYTLTDYSAALVDVHAHMYSGVASRYEYESFGEPTMTGMTHDEITVSYEAWDELNKTMYGVAAMR